MTTDMKRIIIASFAAVLMLSGCKSVLNEKNVSEAFGFLTFDQGTIEVDDELYTKAVVPASGNYAIFIYDLDGNKVVSTSFDDVKKNGNKIKLNAGSYILEARSTSEAVPAAAFEQPVYGTETEFTIRAGEDTPLGNLTCTLLQTKVTVSYNDDFLAMVSGNGAATVSVSPDSPLEYALKYNSGNVSYEQSAGYYAVNNGNNTTMTVTFKGSIDGKNQKMTKVFTNIQPRTWHQIKFVKKVEEEGDADFIISIADFIEDKTIGEDIPGQESIIGDDPDAPQGDGGITLESTCSYDIDSPIVVPAAGSPFVLTMKATIPNKVKKFTVEIQSTEQSFISAVGSVNGGSNILDLVDPSEGAKQVFTEILPFPYGDAVKDKTEILFDLSDAQTPILAFPGTHTFIMHVTDQIGCRKDITVTMIVEGNN